METTTPTEMRRHAPTVVGLILILAGGALFLARQAGLDVIGSIAEAGWPLLVILPGVILLIAAIVTRPPDGIGFAIAGSIVVTVGGILLYQQETGHWESWSYVWALIPGAAGLAMVVYGALARIDHFVGKGLRLMAIAGTLFLVGMWYFETVFRSGDAPIDLATWWPLFLIGIGVVVVARGAFGARESTST